VIKGKAQTGDAFSSDWKGEARGVSHKYDGVEVDKDGKAERIFGMIRRGFGLDYLS
jgi:hypothetical protein